MNRAHAITRSEPAATRPSLKWLFAVAAVFVVSLSFQLHVPVNHDAAWLLEGSRRILHGGVIGLDFIDVSPPLIVWLGMPAVLLSELTDLYLGSVFKLYVAALALLSLSLCWLVLSYLEMSTRLRTQFFFVLSVICIAIQGYDFGQREHFMLILTLPYVLLIVARVSKVDPPGQLVAIVSLAAIFGFCIKPHFLAIPFLLELWVLSRRRKILGVFRQETILLGIGCLIYLAAIFLFAEGYPLYVVPRAVINYGAFSVSFSLLLQNILVLLGPKILVIILFFIFAPKDAVRHPVSIGFLVATLGAFCAALAQSKGWSYHLLPVTGFLAAGGGFIALKSLSEGAIRPSLTMSAAAILLAVTVLKPTINHIEDVFNEDGNTAIVNKIARLLKDTPPSKTNTFAFNTSPRVVHSAILQAGAVWTSTACCYHFLPAAVLDPVDSSKDRETALQRSKIASEQINSIWDEFEKKKPDIVIVDDAEYKLALGFREFDYIAWFQKHETKRFNEIWSHYAEEDRIGYFRIFRRR